MPASNYILSFQLSQWGYESGTGVVINAGTYCATSTDGSVVGVPNPLQSPVVTTGFTGTLPPANYYVKLAFYDASGFLTLPSPERVIQLNSTGQLIVASPVSGLPAGAVGMKVYISATSNTETLQGTTVGSAAFIQSIPLVSGASPSSTNTTLCKQIANDAIWPTGTGYTVALTDTGGNTLPGYPMMWQLMGPNTTINLSTGLPYYLGTVYFPTPILASPLNHALQSISGPLSLTGYNMLNVGAIGVGTSLPAWPIDVENGAINASGGYLFNGSGGTAGQCLISDGTAYDTPATCLTTSGSFSAYQIVDAAGTPLTQRTVLNFDATMAATDSSSPARTNVGLPAKGTAGTYISPQSITFDAQGRETAITAGSAVNRTCNSNGCYLVLPDGTYEEWGIVTMGTAGGTVQTASLTFPHAFVTSESLTVTGGGQADGTNDAYVVYTTGNSTSGATVVLRCSVNIGGGGCSSISQTVPINWIAFGF